MQRIPLPYVLIVALSAWGCTPSIGDKCSLSTDCSIRGDRLCDTSEPNGYCTIFNCRGNLCPDQAACVLFNAAVQGCGYDDRQLSRTGRTFCMAQCHSNSDCRESDGYVCADPRGAPWNADILDDDQTQHVCIVRPDVGRAALTSDPDAAVCQPAVDAGNDARFDAADGAPDSAPDGAPDGGTPDAATDAVSDGAGGD
jgi:hypothetical protein